MIDEDDIKMSPLCRNITSDGTSVEVLIYSEGNYGWIFNPKRKHGRNGMLSPVDFEQQQNWKLQGV
ncbi:MAG: hypothetical protein HOB37_09590 [Rhodospirillaceae bacterium]|mgnify:FL=1|nr:hypothetical protein [Rhodospirillaceae bacterium]MBT6608703.1 hypothetical protein [Rhodospirillaceae bacterium]